MDATVKKQKDKRNKGNKWQRRARRHADAHELIGWINVFETQKRDNRKRERERERAQKMSPSISRQQLGNRKRSTRMKRNFLADEEKEQTRGKLKKKRKEREERKKEFILREDIICQSTTVSTQRPGWRFISVHIQFRLKNSTSLRSIRPLFPSCLSGEGKWPVCCCLV